MKNKIILLAILAAMMTASVFAYPCHRRYSYCDRYPRRVDVYHHDRHHHCWHGRDYAKFGMGMILGAALNEASQPRRTVVVPYEKPVYIPTPVYQPQPVIIERTVQAPATPTYIETPRIEVQTVRPVTTIVVKEVVTTTTTTDSYGNSSIVRQIAY